VVNFVWSGEKGERREDEKRKEYKRRRVEVERVIEEELKRPGTKKATTCLSWWISTYA
jgi:hypothetical protein